MLRPTRIASSMHRARNPRPASARKQLIICRTAYGIIETLRLQACSEKRFNPSELIVEKPKLSADHYLQPTHVRVKRKPTTISQKRKVYINDKEFEA